MTKELSCTQLGNDLCIGTLACQPEAVIVIAEEAQRFVPERTCYFYDTDHEYENSVRCSACQESFASPWEPFRFCPNCGAKAVEE